MINGYIGIAPFYALDGNLSPPQPMLHPIGEPWEDGEGYAELGQKGPIEQLTGFTDFFDPLTLHQTLYLWTQMKLTVVLIQIKVGITWIPYPNYKILLIEDVTDRKYQPVASGGIIAGNYELITRWTVQNVTGVW